MINTTTDLFPTTVFDFTRYFSSELYPIIILIIFCAIGVAIAFFLFKTKSAMVIAIVCAIVLVALVYFEVLSEFYALVGFVIFAVIITILFLSKGKE